MAARAGTLYETPRVPQRRPLEPVARVIITREGERQMSATLSRLRHQLEVDFPARLREARAFGEIDENDDYLQIKEEEAVLAARVERLQALLNSSTVVNGRYRAPGTVTIGSVVELEDLASGKRREHHVTGGYEPQGPNDVSANSPVGQALLGRVIGDEVAVQLSDGRERTLKISAVRA